MRPTSMKVDGTVYWTIMIYDDDGILVDPDSTPSVAVRKNGSSVADAVTVTKRGGTTGIYDASHNPSGEAEGDSFGYEETAILSGQSFLNPWNLEVEADERGTNGASTFNPSSDTVNFVGSVAVCATNSDMRGTDGANTVAPATPSDLSGLSTFDAASDTVTTDTASRNASKADVSGLSTFDSSTDQVVASNMRGTDGANTVAPDNAAIQAISGEVSDLYGNQSQWLTADVSGLATQASVNTIDTNVDTLIANQGDWATADVSGLLTTVTYTASLPANFDDMLIDSSGKVTTSNPASGGGSAHTAQDVANLILAVPTTPLGNTSSGSLSLVDTVTNVTNGGGSGGDSAADIYTYFTSDDREDAFQADVSGLATASQLNGVNSGINMAIAQLNDFNPSSDVVAHVTLVDTTTNLTNQSGGGGGGDATLAKQNEIIADIAALNDFNPSDDVVAHVTLVDTTTNLTNGGGGNGGGTTIVKATPTPRAF